MKSSRHSSVQIEPLGKHNLPELSDLYFRRCNIMGTQSIGTVREYLRKIIESKNHLHGCVIKKGGEIVGSSYVARLGEQTGLMVFTVTDESFTGPEMMLAFGRAYRETLKILIANGIHNIRSVSMEDNLGGNGKESRGLSLVELSKLYRNARAARLALPRCCAGLFRQEHFGGSARISRFC